MPLGDELDDAAALDRVERFLADQYKTVTRRKADEVRFKSSLFALSPNWLAMAVLNEGRFWIEQTPRGRRLRYDLSSGHGLLFCLCSAAFFFIFGLMSTGLAWGVTCALFAFGWLYGVNMLLVVARVPLAIRRAVLSGATEASDPGGLPKP